MRIRPATRADSADIAILDDIASSGLASNVLESGVRAGKYDRPLECGRDGFAFADGPFSWKNVLIAEVDGGVAGMSLSYMLTVAVSQADIPDPVIEPVETLKAQAVGTRFIDSVGVYTRFRGRGMGRALVEAEIARAGDTPSSIITDDANMRALALYRSLGFADRADTPYTAFSADHSATRWVLLVRDQSRLPASPTAH